MTVKHHTINQSKAQEAKRFVLFLLCLIFGWDQPEPMPIPPQPLPRRTILFHHYQRGLKVLVV